MKLRNELGAVEDYADVERLLEKEGFEEIAEKVGGLKVSNTKCCKNCKGKTFYTPVFQKGSSLLAFSVCFVCHYWEELTIDPAKVDLQLLGLGYRIIPAPENSGLIGRFCGSCEGSLSLVWYENEDNKLPREVCTYC